MKLDARTFKKAVLNVCKAIPCHAKCYLNLLIKKETSDMIIYITQSVEKTGSHDFYAAAYLKVFAIVRKIEEPEYLSFYVDPHLLEEYLKKQTYSRNEKISIQIKMNGLLFSRPSQSEQLFILGHVARNNDLSRLKKKRCKKKIQIENFSYYFKETKHALDKPIRHKTYMTSFLLEIDSEDHIRVTAKDRERISIRGDIEETKYAYYLPKAEMIRAATLLEDNVTIRIHNYNEYLQMTAGNILVSMPILCTPYLYEFNSNNLKSLYQKPLLSFTTLREEILKCLRQVMVIGSKDAIFSLKNKTLKLSAVNKITGANITVPLHIEDCPQDTDISLRIYEKYLYEALRSINSINVCLEFIPPHFVRVTDYHINSRRLPHSLSAIEVFWPYSKDTETPNLTSETLNYK